ncbi:hypothetical protein NL676_033358 [Syzygium grande]|nr:hypothetical protein NL676_033358 [Syzygium grande]
MRGQLEREGREVKETRRKTKERERRDLCSFHSLRLIRCGIFIKIKQKTRTCIPGLSSWLVFKGKQIDPDHLQAVKKRLLGERFGLRKKCVNEKVVDEWDSKKDVDRYEDDLVNLVIIKVSIEFKKAFEVVFTDHRIENVMILAYHNSSTTFIMGWVLKLWVEIVSVVVWKQVLGLLQSLESAREQGKRKEDKGGSKRTSWDKTLTNMAWYMGRNTL